MYFQQQKALEELKLQEATQHQQQLEHASGDPSQRGSSVASTGVGANEAPMDRYPMDDIRDKTNYEMHQSMKNISMKVAVGYALPCGPREVCHGREIRAGYAHVRMDAIVPGYESLELDIPGLEDETTLGEV
jgi:hypothetical protein